MSDADTGGGESEPEMVQINLRLSQTFLEDIDTTWKEQGFSSRSEFLRYAARDAVKHPEFSREGWKQIAANEHELRTGRGELVSRDEVVEMMGQEDDEMMGQEDDEMMDQEDDEMMDQEDDEMMDQEDDE